MDIKPEHLAILEATKPHFETAKQGWVQNVQHLDMLEHIYHTYLDHRFILTKWCKDCVIKMLVRLGKWYEQQQVVKHTVFEGVIVPKEALPNSQPKQTKNENTRARKSK